MQSFLSYSYEIVAGSLVIAQDVCIAHASHHYAVVAMIHPRSERARSEALDTAADLGHQVGGGVEGLGPGPLAAGMDHRYDSVVV